MSRSSDEEIRRLERALAAGDTTAKFALAVASWRRGLVVPPDEWRASGSRYPASHPGVSDVEAVWDFPHAAVHAHVLPWITVGQYVWRVEFFRFVKAPRARGVEGPWVVYAPYGARSPHGRGGGYAERYAVVNEPAVQAKVAELVTTAWNPPRGQARPPAVGGRRSRRPGPPRPNPLDEDLRAAERAAAAGDPAAAASLHGLRLRAGLPLVPDAVEEVGPSRPPFRPTRMRRARFVFGNGWGASLVWYPWGTALRAEVAAMLQGGGVRLTEPGQRVPWPGYSMSGGIGTFTFDDRGPGRPTSAHDVALATPWLHPGVQAELVRIQALKPARRTNPRAPSSRRGIPYELGAPARPNPTAEECRRTATAAVERYLVPVAAGRGAHARDVALFPERDRDAAEVGYVVGLRRALVAVSAATAAKDKGKGSRAAAAAARLVLQHAPARTAVPPARARPRKNPDERMRRLERAAAQGDRDAIRALVREAVRTRQPAVVLRLLPLAQATRDQALVDEVANAYWHARGAFDPPIACTDCGRDALVSVAGPSWEPFGGSPICEACWEAKGFPRGRGNPRTAKTRNPPRIPSARGGRGVGTIGPAVLHPGGEACVAGRGRQGPAVLCGCCGRVHGAPAPAARPTRARAPRENPGLLALVGGNPPPRGRRQNGALALVGGNPNPPGAPNDRGVVARYHGLAEARAAQPVGLAKAERLCRSVHGRPAEVVTVFRHDDGLPGLRRVAVVAIGRVPQTLYHTPWQSKKAGPGWVHKHPAGNEPLEVVDPTTGLSMKLGGRYHFANGWWNE